MSFQNNSFTRARPAFGKGEGEEEDKTGGGWEGRAYKQIVLRVGCRELALEVSSLLSVAVRLCLALSSSSLLLSERAAIALHFFGALNELKTRYILHEIINKNKKDNARMLRPPAIECRDNLSW